MHLDDIIKRDYHGCDCPIPNVMRSWQGATGVITELHLCCLARALEAGRPLVPGAYYVVTDFEPTFVWDCSEPVSSASHSDEAHTEYCTHVCRERVTAYDGTENVVPVPEHSSGSHSPVCSCDCKEERGCPPEFLEKRLRAKNIEIKNHEH